MAITNPFSITYGGQLVGGDSGYQLHGAHVIERAHDRLRLVFDVVVVGTDLSDMQSRSDTLEAALSRRLDEDETLEIDLDGDAWIYTHGSTLLAATATITKSGNPEVDRGVSRAYTVTIEAQLPATRDGGLRDIEVLVDYSPGRQKTVTMRGTYTSTEDGGDAVAVYREAFDDEAAAYLSFIDDTATFELVDEDFSMSREQADGTPSPHLCNFTRSYVQLLANQTAADLDAPEVRNHQIVFTDLSQHPGDSVEDVQRLRRVVGNYDCSLDIDETTDGRSVYNTLVRSHIRELIRNAFNPKVFAIEQERVSYDETSKRLSVSLQFIYQTSESNAIVEIAQSVTYEEARNIDYTPTHERDEFAAFADVGFAVLERVFNRVVIAVGDDSPKLRIAGRPRAGDAGLFDGDVAGERGPDARGSNVTRSGWNLVRNQSEATPTWIGDSTTGEQIKHTKLVETVRERFNREPSARTVTPVRSTPITPR